jgi:hypothetical protein
LQQVGTRPELSRRASRSPAPHPVLEALLVHFCRPHLAESDGDVLAAFAETKRITSDYGKLADATTEHAEVNPSKFVGLKGPLPPASWPLTGQIGGSVRDVEVRDMIARTAEFGALDGPFRHRANTAVRCCERGGDRA